MSPTVQQVVADAKSLSSKLKESDSKVDVLLTHCHIVQRQIDILKEYSNDVSSLNELAGHRPHSILAAGIQQENRHLRDLQMENKELRAALEEQESALRIIMCQYRKQISKLVESSSLVESRPKRPCDLSSEAILELVIKISEMALVMHRAAEMDEMDNVKNKMHLQQLSQENESLRKLLNIASVRTIASQQN